jgi:hypothetical protein
MLLVVVAAALVGAACFESGGSATSSGARSASGAAGGRSVEWTIRYPIGAVEAKKQTLPRSCPTDTRCTGVQQPDGADGQPLWADVATRIVSCPLGTPGGDASVDCQAIADLRRALRHAKENSCPCALRAGPAATATAVVHGRTILVSLDLCCAGKVATAAAETLTRTG